MTKSYFKTHLGINYENTRVLILSESTYSWLVDGKVYDPTPSHPRKSLASGIKEFPKRGYFTSMSRAICGTKAPDAEQIRRTWDTYAYTIFVQGTVGIGARKRPNSRQWEDAATNFLRLIEDIRPRKVIVTGSDMWRHHMPPTYIQRSDDLQAYRLSNGELVWCLALPHPSNSRSGFRWDEAGEKIRQFRATTLPNRKQRHE
jgi:hypothetical protein